MKGDTPPKNTREQIFLFMREKLLQGKPPTVREVQEAFGFSAVQSARAHLEKLVAEGRLAKEPGRARGYRLPSAADHALGGPGQRLQASRPTVLVPLLGRVQAGNLTTAVEEREGYVTVRSSSAADLFALRVQGESMRDAGILHGDVVIVRQQPSADSGDVVVALVEDEATVKTLRRRGRRIELHPANPDFAVIPLSPQSGRLLGKVIEVRRFLEGEVQ